MKKTGFILGSIEIILGLFALSINSMLKQVVPKILRIGIQMTHVGSYDSTDYAFNTTYADKISIVLCILGIITMIYFCFVQKE